MEQTLCMYSTVGGSVMYIVKVKGSGDTVAICSRKQDALAYLTTNLDKQSYYVEEVNAEN